MSLFAVGISHRTVPVSVLERFALAPAAQERLLDDVRAGAAPTDGILELAVLSTCNRTELYARGEADRSPEGIFDQLTELLLGHTADGSAVGRRPLYRHQNIDVVRHLCRVAAGLDSMVVGESEILGQIGAAHERAAAAGTLGPLLDELFLTARRAGRRARAETDIARLPTSVGSEAVRLLADALAPLSQRHVLIVGTGKMGQAAAEAVRSQGVGRLSVVSRTARHAEALAVRLGAGALAWHDLPDAIRRADGIICTTGAPHVVVTRELMERAAGPSGDTRQRVVVDIALPRDVEPAVGELPNVHLYDLDTLRTRLRDNAAVRRRAAPAVDGILEQEIAYFRAREQGLAVRPLVARMRAMTETIRRRELDRALRRLGDPSPEVAAALDALSRSLTNKLLHQPTRRLRQTGDREEIRTYASVARDLFGLDDEDESAADASVA